jgi:hypothetical protein
MSSNLNCKIVERKPREWYYLLEQYSQRDEYDEFGPFATFRDAENHLQRNHSNPGGCSIRPLPGCVHDLLRKVEHRSDGDPTHVCDRCGSSVDQRIPEEKARGKFLDLLQYDPELLLLAALSKVKLTGAQRKKLHAQGVLDPTIDGVLRRAQERIGKVLTQ